MCGTEARTLKNMLICFGEDKLKAAFNLLGSASKERDNPSLQFGSQYAMVNDIKGFRKIS